jgi:hypothetical protein
MIILRVNKNGEYVFHDSVLEKGREKNSIILREKIRCT